MMRNRLIFLFIAILLLGFNIYCENAREIEARRAEEREQYCDNARKELDEATRPKVREIYERYYQQGSCTEDNDCVDIESGLTCIGFHSSVFYRNLEEQFRSEIHDINEKCKSDYDFCRSIWPLPVTPQSIPFRLSCVENQCKALFSM